ncbi:MAG: restriction endonuclease [Chloroflexi bacterium]|nr:restriction endonuclease [Chloroflexota bacterium]
MALWLNRAGRRGEYEKRFLQENRLYLTWDGLSHDLSNVKKNDIFGVLLQFYPNAKKATIRNWVGQIWPFVHEMKEGDWVLLPSKLKPAAIHFAEITGPYIFDPKAEDPFYHHHAVKWIATDVPRSNFDQDLLYSFSAFKTVCRIERNNAENRVREMQKRLWKRVDSQIDEESGETSDLEGLARDRIAKLIIQKFKGHGLASLVAAILQAQGYTTYMSPEGPDKGVDILAAPDPLGFGRPRLCVQVKSSETPIDSPTLNQLIGTMQNVQAEQGLLVSWGGFKSSIDRDIPAQFFRVRLWDQDKLVTELLSNYDKLDEDIRADIPLKRIWTVANPEEEV